MNIYVGNLSYETTEDELKEAFAPFGQVDAARIISDKLTNRSRGFGFVEMSDKDEALAAIEKMDGADIGGRAAKVNEARPREERRPNRDSRPRY